MVSFKKKVHSAHSLESLVKIEKAVKQVINDGHLFYSTPKEFTNEHDQIIQYWPYISLDQLLSGDANARYYLSVAAIKSVIGKVNRKPENFHSMWAIMLDDIGTKADVPPLRPSFTIETSPNNFQWWYILSTPITDYGLAQRVVNTIHKSKYTDKNGGNPTRLGRLPMGINGNIEKYGEKGAMFEVRLTEFNDDLTYEYTTILTKLGLDLNKPNKTDKEAYEVPEFIYEKNRNSGLTQLMGHYLRLYDRNVQIAAEQLAIYNETRCVPPLPDSELQGIIKSIAEREQERYQPYIDNLYHVMATDTWYDIRTGQSATSTSLNTQYLKEFPKPLISKWLPKQQGFNKVEDITWSPMPYGHQQRTIIEGNKTLLNTWNGFPIEPIPGNVQPWLDHLEHLIPEPDYRRALLWWIAFTIQQPHLKCSWQPIILGISGAGKDALFRPIATILGRSFKSIGNKDIKGDYDDGLYQTKLLHISEASGLRGNAIEFYKRITAYESSTIQMLNIKCHGKVYQQNICNVLVITNNLDAMKFDKDERRAFVLKAHNVMSEDQITAYFDNWLEHNGAAHLFHYLLNYDLSEYSLSRRPYKTTYFDELFAITRSDEEVKLEDFLQDYEAARPELLADMFGGDDRYAIQTVTLWLEKNGWARWDDPSGPNPGKKIQKKVDNKKFIKNRNWYVKKDGKFHKCRSVDMFDEADRIEKLFSSLTRSKF